MSKARRAAATMVAALFAICFIQFTSPSFATSPPCENPEPVISSVVPAPNGTITSNQFTLQWEFQNIQLCTFEAPYIKNMTVRMNKGGNVVTVMSGTVNKSLAEAPRSLAIDLSALGVTANDSGTTLLFAIEIYYLKTQSGSPSYSKYTAGPYAYTYSPGAVDTSEIITLSIVIGVIAVAILAIYLIFRRRGGELPATIVSPERCNAPLVDAQTGQYIVGSGGQYVYAPGCPQPVPQPVPQPMPQPMPQPQRAFDPQTGRYYDPATGKYIA